MLKHDIIKTIFVYIFAFFIIAAPFFYYPDNKVTAVSSPFFIEENNFIVLDAGHGGEDGGAIGHAGIIEKNLNLSITLKAKSFFNFFGYDIVLTREDDRMTCDDGLKNQRERKVSDIKNRLKLMEKTPCLCFISIHQNIFGGDAHGAQVFYSKNTDESKKLANSLQSGISSLLQPENRRLTKEAGKNIYILYHAQKPAVLVECGFISNSKEAAMLSDNEYQNKMAFAISVSAIKHLTEKEE